MNSVTYLILFALILVSLLISMFFSSRGNLQRSLFTSAIFYGSVILAVLIFSLVNSETIISLVIGSGILSVGISVWIFEWNLKKLRTVDAGKNRNSHWIRIFGMLIVLSVIISLLYARPLPWIGNQAMEAGQEVRAMLPSFNQINERIRNRIGSKAKEPQESNETSKGFGNRRELPRSGNITLKENEVMYLRIPDKEDFNKFISKPNYVRSRVLDKYTSDVWELDSDSKEWISDNLDGSEDGWVMIGKGDGIEHEIFLPSAGGVGIPSIQNAIGFGLDFVLDSGADNFDAELRGAVTYKALSRPLVWREGSDNFIPGNIDNKFSVGAEGNLGRRIRLLFAEITEGLEQNSAQRLNAVLSHLRQNYKYSTEIKNESSLPPMENFLFHEYSGWCDYFATAAALLAREAGFPSRTAYGYSGGVVYEEERAIAYRSKDAHSWAEIFVENKGWVVFDATPPGSGAAVVAEKKSENANFPDLQSYKDANFDDSEATVEISERKPKSLFMWLAIIFGICGFFLIRIMIKNVAKQAKEIRPDESGKKYSPWDRNSPAYLIEFLKMCMEIGQPKVKGETVREAISKVSGLVKGEESFEKLSNYHYSIQYAGGHRDRSIESQLKRSFRRLRKKV